jgi:hypothetical protein
VATGIQNQGKTASARMAAGVLTDGWWLLALGAALFGISLIALARDMSHWGATDLTIYRHAGLTALRSGDLYCPAFGGGRLTYPPFSALLFTALTGPLSEARWLMTGASTAALAVTGWMAAGLYALAGLAILCAVALVVSSYPTSRSPAGCVSRLRRTA